MRRAGYKQRRERDENPTYVCFLGSFKHNCEEDAVFRLKNEMIPCPNSAVYFENKTQLGKIDEVFGPTHEVYFSVKLNKKYTFKSEDKVYISQERLLDIKRFQQDNKTQKKSSQKKPEQTQKGNRNFTNQKSFNKNSNKKIGFSNNQRRNNFSSQKGFGKKTNEIRQSGFNNKRKFN